MLRQIVAFAVFACLPVAAAAAPVSIAVLGADSRPLSGAVVTVEARGAPASTPRGTYAVEQRDIAFRPGILIVPVGATVTFPNRDRVRHHVYSFSKPKRFDLKLYGRQEERSIVFDKPGVVALGCNIHDTMAGVVFVTATPFAEATGADGRVTLAGVPAGEVVIRVWHPSIRAPGNSLSRAATVPAAGLSTALSLHR